jgi:hypothetical protein
MSTPPPTIYGWANESIPYRMATPLGTPRASGVVFPGAAYGQDRPLCALTRDVLVAAAVETFLVDRSYALDPSVRGLVGEEREGCIALEAGAFARVAFERARGAPVILAGKSLGTTSMAHALRQVPDLAAFPSIWLTPLWKDEAIFNAIAAAGSRALVRRGASCRPREARQTGGEVLAGHPRRPGRGPRHGGGGQSRGHCGGAHRAEAGPRPARGQRLPRARAGPSGLSRRG